MAGSYLQGYKTFVFFEVIPSFKYKNVSWSKFSKKQSSVRNVS